jgi:hypothetical protein
MASDPARRLDVPGCYEIYGSEEAAMITHTTVQALGQARLGDLHDQARRDALVRAARRAAARGGSGPGQCARARESRGEDLCRQTEKGDQVIRDG